MSVQQPPPKVTRVTTVSNISTTSRFPVERASNAQRPPQTRPPQAARPAPVIVSKPSTGVSKEMTPLRISLEAMVKQPGPSAGRRTAPVRMIRPPVHTGGINDPPEGVGSGSPPPGGVKMR
jgi:hypothetical protein